MSLPSPSHGGGQVVAARRIRPGWYLLAAITLYAVVVTVLLATRPPAGASDATRGERSSSATTAAGGSNAGGGAPAGSAQAGSAAGGASASNDGITSASIAVSGGDVPAGLWFPIPGAGLPSADDYLPGAPRAYRNGVSQGFDFHDGDAGVPITYGTPVIAAASGNVVRADTAHVEMDQRAWDVLLADVAAEGADEEQLDRLRGRQLWIRTSDGTVLRYGHLAGIRDGVRVGSSVFRGQVVGYAGNSGTDVGVTGRRDGVRLRFEIWPSDDAFFGEDLEPTQVRLRAASLFSGP
ncbi:MAG: M23 family metallopeptidase [Trueperaceae bacterium]